MKYLGCAYYPEYWGVERVETDARLMKAAGIDTVRIGEFAWSRMEPEEGVFDLDWLHDAVEVLGRHGIKVLMCTPTATPPAWLTGKYPDTLLVRGDGTTMLHGARRHYCPSSKTYRGHCRRIAEKLSSELARHKNVFAWQIDNELGPESGWCHCESCQAAFRDWLKARYKTVGGLNDAWKTGFWSVDYSGWDQIRLDDCRLGLYSSQNLDSRRFRSELMIDFCGEQEKILRRNHPGAKVTTNGMGPVYSPIDYYKLFENLDAACDDLYFDTATMDGDALALNVFRSIKQGHGFWLTETGSGALDHNKPPHPGQFRAWMWSSFAHGGEAHLVFRWRTCLSGHEQELQGILGHSGRPGSRYETVKGCFLEMKALCRKFGDLPLPEAGVAIVQDYQTLWGYESSRIGRDVDYHGLVQSIHKEFYRRNVLADIIPPGRDLRKYKLVVLPSVMIIPEDFAAELKSFVKAGGVLLAIGQIGIRDSHDNYIEAQVPSSGMAALLGISIEGGTYLKDHCHPERTMSHPDCDCRVESEVSGSFKGRKINGKAGRWIAEVSAPADITAFRFTDEIYAGRPAITCKKSGKGTAIYSAAIQLSDSIRGATIDHCLEIARPGIWQGPSTSLHVEAIKRGDIILFINHNNKKETVEMKIKAKPLLGELKKGKLKLPPYGVAALKLVK